MITVLLGLLLGGAGVVTAGVVLARAGDLIAAHTRMGGLWIGAVFLALATSLPEFLTSGIAVRLGSPDIAAGNLFGSNMANMLILGLINLRPGSDLFRRAALDQALSVTHATVLTAVATAFILIDSPSIFGTTGPGALLILALYIGGSRILFMHSATLRAATAEPELAREPEFAGHAESPASGQEKSFTSAAKDRPPLASAIRRFLLGAALILVAAPLFTYSADRGAELTGISESFIGTVVMGIATSLPELVTSLMALRLRAYDLAVGNLFGSNAVNMAMFGLLDPLHSSGPILAEVSLVHAFTGVASIIMMALGLAAIVYRAKGRFSMLEPSSLLLVLTYLASVAMIFTWGT